MKNELNSFYLRISPDYEPTRIMFHTSTSIRQINSISRNKYDKQVIDEGT